MFIHVAGEKMAIPGARPVLPLLPAAYLLPGRLRAASQEAGGAG